MQFTYDTSQLSKIQVKVSLGSKLVLVLGQPPALAKEGCHSSTLV